jgi:UDP-glucuronate 4-epimerase
MAGNTGKMSERKILITGGAGFIGSHAAERFLRDGWKVGILDDFNDFYDPALKDRNLAGLRGDVEIHRADIRNSAEVERLMAGGWETILHLAARAGIRPSISDPRLYVETNVTGTFNVLEAARRLGVRKFLFASSSSVYGGATAAPFRECEALAHTLSPYAATKIAGEQLCSTYAHLHGIQAVVLRLFTVYGPSQRPDLAIHKFTKALFEDAPIDQYGEGHTGRDYTYVEDVVNGIRAAADYQGPAYDVFNLGGSQPVELRELIAKLELLTGKKASIRRYPEQAGDMKSTWADISKARELLGYSPTTSIDEGLEKFLEWYKAENLNEPTG